MNLLNITQTITPENYLIVTNNEIIGPILLLLYIISGVLMVLVYSILKIGNNEKPINFYWIFFIYMVFTGVIFLSIYLLPNQTQVILDFFKDLLS